MDAKLGVLIIHGIGSHEPGFTEPMKAKLRKRISNNDFILWEEVCWADRIEDREDKLLKRLFPEGKHPHWLLKWLIRFKLRQSVEFEEEFIITQNLCPTTLTGTV